MSAAVLLKVLDFGLLLMEAGLQRQQIVAEVQAAQAAGASDEEIADMLRDGRIKSEIERKAAVEKAEGSPKP